MIAFELLLFAIVSACVVAATPSVNVALKASFNAAPYLVELLETAADENSTAYFPLLDKIAAGHFDDATTDRNLYHSFVKTLQDDGHVDSPEALSSFTFALSIRAAAPRIEAHYQFYNTSFGSLVSENTLEDCEDWLHFQGKRYCSPDLAQAARSGSKQEPLTDLPFDRVLGDAASETPSILYADITSPVFRNFHQTVSRTAKSGKTSYRVRYRPSYKSHDDLLPISGYGVELALKRTDYIVIDDREAEDAKAGSSEASGEQIKLDDAEVTDLRPLSSSELQRLGLKAATFVLRNEDPFGTLEKLVQDFPKHSAAIAAINVSRTFLSEHVANRAVVLPSGSNVIWINGVQILARDFDAFSLLEHLRKERKLMASAEELGLTAPQAVELLSHDAISDASSSDEPQRYDWRDDMEGGQTIIWLNNIEKDKRYAEWPENVQALLQRTFPGQLPAIRKSLHHIVVPVDFASPKDVELVVQNIQTFVKRMIPIQFGLVPQTGSKTAKAQAAVIYHLVDTYGLAPALQYLSDSLKADGRKHSTPKDVHFQKAIQERVPRKGKVASPLQDIVGPEVFRDRISASNAYLKRLGLIGESAPFLVNGVAVKRDDNWMQLMSQQTGIDLQMIQQEVYVGNLAQDDHLPDFFLAKASIRRNPVIVPEDEKDAKFVDLATIPHLEDGKLGSIQSISASPETIESELVHLAVIADFNSRDGAATLSAAVAFRKEHDNVELFVIDNAGEGQRTYDHSEKVRHIFIQQADDILTALQSLEWNEPSNDTEREAIPSEGADYWHSAKPLINAAGAAKGQSAVVLNGRVIGPTKGGPPFDQDDFETMLSYERRKRLIPAAAAFKDLGLLEKVQTPLAFARLSNLIALSTVSDVPEGIFQAAPTSRTSAFQKWKHESTAIETGSLHTATIQLVASIDPASELAQRWVPIIKVLSELRGVHTRIFLNPKEQLEELPVKRFYRHVLESKPSFNEDGSVQALRAHFSGLPADALLTTAMDMPPAWLVSPKDSVHDLDNIKLSSVKSGDIEATYELEHILIEGHSRDITTGQPPRGAQLVMGTRFDAHQTDTIVMANLGYFQFKANPGFYNLALQRGRSEQIFRIDSAGTLGYGAQPGDETTDIALTSFRGLTLFPRVSRKRGMEDEDVLEASKSTIEDLADKAGDVLANIGLGGEMTGKWLSKAQKFGSSLFPGSTPPGTDLQTLPHADINIFSVASGHLYERMLNIMMVSVMKHTSHTVKFWFIEQFLSPSFRAFLPALAEEYGFRYEMVTYKWPHWLRGQKEKQREIWGYKILFLDVLFPLDLDKVIFVDADQIVRTDMYELVQHDLHGAPYGFTPMCDSRTEMEGFRFWKQGYWKNYLRGLPYHISALYVVDLVRFRQIAAGDRLRQQYHQLSADPASLSNLDQDLPNHMQHVLPIHSLPQEWLWCETWCSDESLGVARTIDLCNNPQTKEPKLERARRQVPEWTVYDEEIAALARRKAEQGGHAPIAGTADGAGTQAELQKEEADRHRREQELAKAKIGIKDEL